MLEVDDRPVVARPWRSAPRRPVRRAPRTRRWSARRRGRDGGGRRGAGRTGCAVGGSRLGHAPIMPTAGSAAPTRASTAQWSARPSVPTATNDDTRSTTGQMWLGTTATTSPIAGRGDAAGQGDHAVVVVELLDDRARPGRDRAEALDERGLVLGQDLAPASSTARPVRVATTVAATNAATSSGPIAPERDLLAVAEGVRPGAHLGDAAGRGQRPGGRRSGPSTDTSNPAASSAAAPRSSAVTSSSATPPAAPGGRRGRHG